MTICRDLKLFAQAAVAIDGSKFKAVNSRDQNFTPNKIARRQEQIEQSIQRYLDALETADRTQPVEVEAKTERLREKIDRLREQMRDLDHAAKLLNDLPEKQISLTDPDSRSMLSQAKGTGVVGYNVQIAVDTRHHLIVSHEVTNVGNDRNQLSSMAKAARDAMGRKTLKVLADRGYFSAPEIKACDDAGIAALVPKSQTSGAKADGRFDRADFVYIAAAWCERPVSGSSRPPSRGAPARRRPDGEPCKWPAAAHSLFTRASINKAKARKGPA